MKLKFLGVLALFLCSVLLVYEVSLRGFPSTQTAPISKAGDGEKLVIILGGSEGGAPRASRLEKDFLAKGYSVAKLTYFGAAGTPKQLSQIDINAIAAEIRNLRTEHGCIGIAAASKGSELALLLASSFPDLTQVTVAMVPSDVVWQSSQVSLLRSSSWRLHGDPLPYVPYRMLSLAAIRAAFDVNKALDLHLLSLRNELAGQKATIPVEKISQPVLLQGALRDQIWPSALMAKRAFDRAQRLNPDTQLVVKQYDHDHYLLGSRQAHRDLLGFVDTHLSDCAG